MLALMRGGPKGEGAPLAWRTAAICTADQRGRVGVNNSVSTIKYKLSAFKPWFPYAIIEQFRRAANVYYLVISVAMIIGESAPQLWVTPYASWSTSGVLVFVLILTALKEGYEDLRRYRSDRAENNAKVLARAPQKGPLLCKDLRVGDLVVLRDRQVLPADAVLLTSSAANGVAYVDTANIDGETNLKLREPPLEVAHALGSSEDAAVVGTISFEPPSRHIHNFSGSLKMRDGVEHPLTASSLLLRGSVLRNVEFALAVVVYTGSETKVAMNSTETPSKMSLVERTINASLGAIMVPYLIFTTVSAAIATTSTVQTPYLEDSGGTAVIIPAFLSFWVTFFILYCFLIPISLYVTIEVVNLLQAWLITQDTEMYDPKTNTPAVVRSSNLCQELGQLQYIFSDKTGTLTANEMVLRFLSLGGIDLVSSLPAAPTDTMANQEDEAVGGMPLFVPANDSPVKGGSHHADVPVSAGATALKNNSVPLENLLRLAAGRPGGVSNAPRDSFAGLSFSESPETLRARSAAELLAVCHTVLPQMLHGRLEYQGESPDEVALVEAAASVGYRLIRREGDEVVVAVGAAAASAPEAGQGGKCPAGCEELSVRVLAVNQFNSTRKRMSCLVKYPDGSHVLYCKGADTNMFPLLEPRSTAGPEAQLANDHLRAYAREGLRTLVLAKRALSSSQASEWLAKFKAASVARTDRDGQLSEAAASVEQNLVLVGLTAIEDKLQDGVPQTLEYLRRGGLKIWVLTGDKVETAVNIGFSSKLLTTEMTLLYVGASPDGDDTLVVTKETLREQLRELTAHYADQILAQLPHLLKSTTDGTLTDANREALADRLTEAPKPSLSGMSALFGRAHAVNRSLASLWSPFGAPRSGKAAEVEATTLALIVDGNALALVFEDEGLKEALLHLGRVCASVLACRVSPKQKAQVVELVRQGVKPEPLTLAIGDGANDVAMIQSAHIGIGISGKEGMQAVNSADFAIAQFRFLLRLLLLHGRWNYTRMSKVVLYYYYKNFVLTLTLFVYNFQTVFSGTSLYESLMASAYNIVLFLPIVFVGALDQDIAAETVMQTPELYVTGRTNMHLNTPKVAVTMFEGLLTGGVIVAIASATYRSQTDGGLYELGVTVYSWLFLIMQWKLAVESDYWSKPLYAIWWAHNVLYFVFLAVYSYLYTVSTDFYGVGVMTMANAEFWLACIVVVGASIILDVTLEFARLQFKPTLVDIYKEIDRGYGDGGIEERIRAHGALDRLREALGIFKTPTVLKRPKAGAPVSAPGGSAVGKGGLARGASERSSYDFTMSEVPLSKRGEILNRTLEARASSRSGARVVPPSQPPRK